MNEYKYGIRIGKERAINSTCFFIDQELNKIKLTGETKIILEGLKERIKGLSEISKEERKRIKLEE